MKKRMAVWLAAGLAATAAWGQNLVGSLEIRGLQDFLDTAMTMTAGTPLEGRPAMLPAMLQGAFGINVLQLVEPHGTIRCDCYEKDGDQYFRLALPVDDPEAFFGKLGPSWTEEESEGAEGETALRTFAQDYGNGRKGRALTFRSEPGRMYVMLKENTDAEVMARGAEAAMDIAGTLAIWVNASNEFWKQATQQSPMPAGWEFEDVLFGLALPDGDKLEVNFSTGCSEALAASLPEGVPGADVHMVNLPGAIAASVSKSGSADSMVRSVDEVKTAMAGAGVDLPEAFWKFWTGYARTFADGDTGFVLLPSGKGEGAVPEFAVYLTPKNAGDVRTAMAEKSQAFLDKILEDVADLEEGAESPLQFVPGEVRTAAGAEIDAWTLLLADTEENREDAEENGWTLPKELVTFEVAWLDNGAMVLSTLGGGKLDGMLARRIDGTLANLSEAETYAGLFGAGASAPMMGFVQVIPLLRCGADFLENLDEEFAELGGVLSDLPQVDAAMACRAEVVGGRRLNESLRVKLQDVKELALYGIAKVQQRYMEGGDYEFEEEEEEMDFEFEEEAEEIDFDAEDDGEESAEEAAEEAAE